MLKLVILLATFLVCNATPTGLPNAGKLFSANPIQNSVKSTNTISPIATDQLPTDRPIEPNQVHRAPVQIEPVRIENVNLPPAGEAKNEIKRNAPPNKIDLLIADREKSFIKSNLSSGRSDDQSRDQSSDSIKSAIKTNRPVESKESQPYSSQFQANNPSNFDRQPYEAREDRLPISMLASDPTAFDDQMQNDDEDQMDPLVAQEEAGIYEQKFDFSDPDLGEMSFYPANSDQTNGETHLSTISTNACQVDRCKSANRTMGSEYHMVDCLSENLVYNCYYCPKEHVLIEQKRTCIGPCENEKDCELLLDYYKHVECPPYDYEEDPKDQNMCIKKSSIRSADPLSISLFYPKHWNLRQADRRPVNAIGQIAAVDRVDGPVADLQETTTSHPINNTTGQTDAVDLNRKLVHQIRLKDYKNENNEEVCDFKMQIERINQQSLFDDEPKNHFTMESQIGGDELGLINVYLNLSSVFDSAIVSLNCVYKGVVLHRTELHFLQDNI